MRIIDSGKLYNSKIERLVISCGLGFLVISVIQLYAISIKLPLNKINILLLVSPFIFVKLYYSFRSGIAKSIRTHNIFKIKDFFAERRRIFKEMRVVEKLLVVFMILLCLIMLLVCLLMPMYTYDSRATWGFKAKILFNEQTIFTDDFLDPYRFHPNISYPILIPLVENFFYNMLGRVDDYSVKVIFALFYISLLFFLYITQRKYFSTSRMHSLIFTSIFASLPFLFVIYNGSVPSAYVDFPLACFFTLAMVYLFNYMKSRNMKHIIIASLFFCCCLFSKNEGIALFLISILVLIMDAFVGKYIRDKKSIRAFLIYLFLPLIILLPWFMIKSKLPTLDNNNPLSYFVLDNLSIGFSRLGLIIKLTLGDMFLNFRSWGIIWIIVVIAMTLNYRQDKKIYSPRIEMYLLIIPIIYYFLILTPIYMFYIAELYPPLENAIGFDGANAERLRLHAFPLLLLFISLRVNRLFNQQIDNDL
ncbi:MAG: glycosyltransferase family 39 protein [Parcubacteria group bacterium]|nr:glycosyltransferase family 39 protein [Parcubacteria group bacterium]